MFVKKQRSLNFPQTKLHSILNIFTDYFDHTHLDHTAEFKVQFYSESLETGTSLLTKPNEPSSLEYWRAFRKPNRTNRKRRNRRRGSTTKTKIRSVSLSVKVIL